METVPFRLLAASAVVGSVALVLLLVRSRNITRNADARHAADYYSMSLLYVWLAAALVVFLRGRGHSVRPFRMLLAGLIYQGTCGWRCKIASNILILNFYPLLVSLFVKVYSH